MKLLFTLLFLFSVISLAQISTPRNPKDRRPIVTRPGIGLYEKNQSLTRHFMRHVGVKATDTYENTNLLMKDLIFKLAQNELEVREWLIEVNKYFESRSFKQQSQHMKNKEVFEARLYIKLAIKEFGVLIPPRYSR